MKAKALFVILVFSSISAWATVIHVPADQPTIQAGINAASSGDTILVSPGTYAENDTLKSGITLLGEKGADSTIISGGGPVIIGLDCLQVFIQGFTMTGGNVGWPGGGGLKLSGCEVYLDYCNIVGNRTYQMPGGPVRGGGIYAVGSQLSINRCIIAQNVALGSGKQTGGEGGGIYCDGSSTLLVKNSVIKNNRAQGEDAAYGGGICSLAPGTIIDSNLVVGNQCLEGRYYYAKGGGIYLPAGGSHIRSNVIANNSVSVYGANSCSSDAEGGGVYAINSEIFGNTFYGNLAYSRNTCFGPYLGATAIGGGIAGSGNMGNNVFAANECSTMSCPNGYICLITANGAGASGIFNSDCNDYYSNFVNDTIQHVYGFTYGLNDFSADPLFCLPESLDFHLLENSPCINALNCGSVGALSTGCTACIAIAGDANASNSLSLSDIIAAVNYIFNNSGCSVAPDCWLSNLLCRGDWNGDLSVSLGDVIQGVNYIFNKPGGPWNPLPSGLCCKPLAP